MQYVLLFLLALAAPASAAWRRVDTPNFIVVGDVSVRQLRNVATKFEGFHEALRHVLPSATTTAPVPTVVIVFPNDAAFAPYRPTYQGKARADVAGYAAAGLDVNYIAMLDLGDSSERVIFHEYTHMILANAVARMPVWLNEGLAEFYSTFALMDGGKRAQIGRPIVEHLQLLHGSVRVPIAELLKVDTQSPLYNEGTRASDFYAESWALTHMLLNGQPPRVDQLSDYLRRVGDGTVPAEAWETVFGTERTENELRRYVTKPTYTTVVIDFSEKIVAVPAVERPLSTGDAAAFLAAIQQRRGAGGDAARLLEPALSAQPSNVLAQAAMARVEIARGDAPAAEKRLMALDASDDWFAAYQAGLALLESAERQHGMSGIAPALARSTQWLQQVRKDHGELPNVLASLARIELEGEKPSAAARDHIARARALAPGRVDYALTQAEIFAEARDFANARRVVGPLMSSLYPEDVRNGARRLMAGLVELERAVSGGPAIAPSGRSRSVGVPDADAGKPPRESGGSARFVPAFRRVEAGEHRLEGTLERIDCPAGGPARFAVREPAGVTTLGVARMTDVDFISYRDDLSGSVSCGALKEPIRVYVTWKDGASPAAEKVVVAVEFLPKN